MTNKVCRPAFVGSEIFRRPAFGANHPLAFSRISGVWDVCMALNWLPQESRFEVEMASVETLLRLHDASYREALFNAVERGSATQADRATYNIGTMENPIFPGLYERAATTVAGSIRAAELALERGVSFHPSGGTHHGRRDKANGFCYFNDPAYAILTFLDKDVGPVLYLDVDAHHGDGVQDYFEANENVWTVSIHEADRWPHTGALDDKGQGRAINIPVPRGCTDSDYDYLMKAVVYPLIERVGFKAAVITCGADALKGDPLSAMELSNSTLWKAIGGVIARVPHVAILGGGGYNPWTTVRCWAGLWGYLNGYEMPETLPKDIVQLFEGLDSDLVDEEDRLPSWYTRLDDPSVAGEARDAIVALVATLDISR